MRIEKFNIISVTGKACFLIFSLSTLIACQSIHTKKENANFEAQFNAGQYGQAASTAINYGKITPQGETKDLLWSLQAGAALSCVGNHELSNKVLDNAEKFMKIEDNEGLAKKGGEQVVAVLLNNSFNDYDPGVYDSVMTNTIKGFNFIMLKDYQNARIEFNRSADRQRRAKEFFSKKIDEQKKKVEEQSNQENFSKNMSTSQKVVDEKFSDLSHWEVYPDFVNPYTDYLHGLFFLLTGSDSSDFGKARDSMRRVAGMSPDNPFVKADLKIVDNIKKGKLRREKLQPSVWVIFENGLAPKVEEILIPIPLLLVSNKIDYMQIALPKLVVRPLALPYLEINNVDSKKIRTVQLASLERVIKTEFKMEYSYRITQAIMSTIVKAMIQKEAQKKGGMGSLLGAIYQAATTRADTRSWTALPNEFQVAKLLKPADGKLEITAPGLAQPLNIDLPEGQFAIVHVKMASASSEPTYQVATF
jgi:hypothetical protein